MCNLYFFQTLLRFWQVETGHFYRRVVLQNEFTVHDSELNSLRFSKTRMGIGTEICINENTCIFDQSPHYETENVICLQ